MKIKKTETYNREIYEREGLSNEQLRKVGIIAGTILMVITLGLCVLAVVQMMIGI